MISSELKSIVAENCPEYDAYSIFNKLSMSALSESCDSCTNYIKNKCTKNLLNEMSEKIRVN